MTVSTVTNATEPDTGTDTDPGSEHDAPATPGHTVGRPAGRHDEATIPAILDLISDLPVRPSWASQRQARTPRGARSILRWLQDHPGTGWQQRWTAAGADNDLTWLTTIPVDDGAPQDRSRRRALIQNGLAGLVLARVVAPSYGLLAQYRANTLLVEARCSIQPERFAEITAAASRLGMSAKLTAAGLNIITKIVLHTGLDLEDVTFGEFDAYRRWAQRDRRPAPTGINAAWDMLREAGVLPGELSYRARRRAGPQSTSELADRYGIRHGAVRDVLTRYLDHRRPSLDYKSFTGLATYLLRDFWADLQAHHPDLDSLGIPQEAATAWKERLKTVTTRSGATRERRNYHDILVMVRSFYLDLQEWALSDPTWAAHAHRSPVQRGETSGLHKHRKKVISEVHQRIRERVPALPALVDTASNHLDERQSLLAAAARTTPGEEFDHRGIRYRRTKPGPRADRRVTTVRVENLATGEAFDVFRSEEEAFWAWAIIETLRHTGIRIEELLELSHLALASYRLPDNDEVVPLLQIVPSKTDQERLLLVGPELASVLATVISRLRSANNGTVPLTTGYDRHERQHGPPLPLLFQRRTGHRNEVISVTTVQDLLDATLSRSGLCDVAGEPLRFTPHDFRRIFATESLAGGLPVHIVARLLGHAHISSTEPYTAVFQDELIQTYRGFLEQRRSLRPEIEYRKPTDEEWREFEHHFALRKLELGTCARPYGTPCKHEHACIRCPMLHVDPAARGRLNHIIANLAERIDEAKHNRWLGEVEGLQVSLRAARSKLASLDRVQHRTGDGLINLGIPSISQAS